MSLSTGEKVALGVPAIAVLVVVGTLWSGYVLSTMWGWYVVPLGLPAVNWAAASGLSAIVGMLRIHSYQGDNGTMRKAVTKVLGYWLGYALCLGIGRLLLNFATWGSP